jgi:uncharacterized protein YqeY
MSIKEQIEVDLKQAMLAGDKVLTETLRGLKSAILNVEVAENKREQGLTDEEVVSLFQKEAKKRQESAELFERGGNMQKAQEESVEKKVIEAYLPSQMDDNDLNILIDTAIQETNAEGLQSMGQVIGLVKQKAGGQADGSRIAAAVKERLAK